MMETTVPMCKLMVAHCPRNSTLQRLIQALAKRKPPSIHDEFPKHLDWPGGFDKVQGEKMLRVGYLDALNNPWNVAFMMGLGEFPVDEFMILKRWNSRPRFLGFYHRQRQHILSLGDYVDLQPGTTIAYDDAVRSVFVNMPSNALMVLEAGAVHISIGFNDLGELLSHAPAAPHSETALRFVGVEKSEFAVARSS